MTRENTYKEIINFLEKVDFINIKTFSESKDAYETILDRLDKWGLKNWQSKQSDMAALRVAVKRYLRKNKILFLLNDLNDYADAFISNLKKVSFSPQLSNNS